MKLITFLPSLAAIAIAFPFITPGVSAAEWDPSKYYEIFGDPNEFVQKIEDTAKPQLNEWMGLGVASFGFGLVLRALVR